ncbi:RINGv domain-containing protein [Cephalotus follicularis]|uniref:RINGv domain-containing protein n=1 Tax=Cephalotus follicularis TaxID=3775 RepID=A0A1Q3C2T8_CEPFO|nr:RINGv domain-containing protein [Cephalotus follicularis]
MPSLGTPHYHTDLHNHGDDASLSSDSHFSGEIGDHRDSSVSNYMSDVDLESGVSEVKVGFDDKVERDCRICHLGLDSGNQENGVAIQLGCSCKGDLGAAHKKCAETWFKIKGNMICEICGATALHVAGEQTNEASSTTDAVTATALLASSAPVIIVGTRNFWNSRRVMNFLLACMVFAFVISWLFHFKVLS